MDDKRNIINDPDLVKQLERKYHCPHCHEEIDGKGDVCPFCRRYLAEGRTEYEPLNPKTSRTIRWILGIILFVVFVVLFIVGVIQVPGWESCESTDRLVNIQSVFLLGVKH